MINCLKVTCSKEKNNSKMKTANLTAMHGIAMVKNKPLEKLLLQSSM
jgi:hypothetical protein